MRPSILVLRSCLIPHPNRPVQGQAFAQPELFLVVPAVIETIRRITPWSTRTFSEINRMSAALM